MTDRYFQNSLSDYSEQDDTDLSDLANAQKIPKTAEGFSVNLAAPFRQLYLPNSEKLSREALNLKDEIVQATWEGYGRKVRDPFLYTGMLGTAYLCFQSYQVTGSKNDLDLCIEIIDHCTAAAMPMKQYVTFICGQPGIYALGAAAAKCHNDKKRVDYYVGLFEEVANERALAVGPAEGGLGMPYELLYGRAGFLWAALFLNKYIGEETIPWTTTGPIVDAIIAAGRAGASNTSCPLVYQWHGTRYWGAAHGLAGIMHVLLHFPLSKEDADDVKGTLHYMINHRFVHSGNYPSSDGNQKDKLVHWCHGAPGVALALCKAAQVFDKDDAFRQAAIEAGEVVWNKGLLRRVGLCHGVSGNTYVFLALYRLTGSKKHLHRARAFAGFLYHRGRQLISKGEMHGGDHPYSLFEGLAGMAYMFLDMVQPEKARFLGFEL